MVRPKKFFITSNYSIEECFVELPQVSIEALKRRFEERYIGPSDSFPMSSQLSMPGQVMNESSGIPESSQEYVTLEEQLDIGEEEFNKLMMVFK